MIGPTHYKKVCISGLGGTIIISIRGPVLYNELDLDVRNGMNKLDFS